ncbi:MAG: hypothetical protein ABIP94_23435 [Planctomycetota bacterium]
MLSLVLACVLPTIWIVDATSGPGTHFTDLPPAVAAAQSGDTILVRPGTYTAFDVSGKALTIRGTDAMTTVVALQSPVLGPSPSISIANTPAGTTFYLSFLTVRSNTVMGDPILPTMSVSNAKVVLVGCTVSGNNGTNNRSTALIVGNAEVHANRCTFLGAPGYGFFLGVFGGGNGVTLSGASLAADACVFQGGSGLWHLKFPVIFGGHGISINSSRATIVRSSCIGGSTPTLLSSGTAGSGVVIQGTSMVRFVGGAGMTCMGGQGSTPGQSLIGSASTPVIVHGPVAFVPPPVGSSTVAAPPLPYLTVTGDSATLPVTVDLDGLFPNALYFLKVSSAPDYVTSAPWGLGEILVSLSTSECHFGLLDPTGRLAFTFTPASVPELLNRPICSQAAVFDAATGQLRLSQSDIRIFAL